MQQSTTDPNARPRVLALAATGQSGATILTRMLGQLPGFVAVGELGRLFDKGIADNTECGCGLPFHDCPFWRRVGEDAFGGWNTVDVAAAMAARRHLERRRRHLTQLRALPLQLRPGLSHEYTRAETHYLTLLGRIYSAIDHATNGSVIVDSMKESWHVFALTRLETVDLRVVHQVRDSRGVAYSSTRRVPRQGGDAGTYRGQFRPLNTGARWMWTNLAFEILARTATPTTVSLYEATVDDPRAELGRIAQFAGRSMEAQDTGFIQDGALELTPDHVVAGNRVRMTKGPMPLRRDEEWRHGLARRDQLLVSALTWPLLRRYAARRGSDAVGSGLS